MTRSRATSVVTLLTVALLTACSDPDRTPTAATTVAVAAGASAAKAPSGPTVTSTDPGESVRDTTLDVRVLGSGFDQGSRADFLLSGVADPKVVTNSTRFVSSSEVVANITIAVDAVATYRDVAVTTSTGKKGIGTQKFQVLSAIVLSIPGASPAAAVGVNSSGLVVGHYNISAPSCTRRAFAWTEAGGTIVLPLPAGYCQGWASDVNESGVIVGYVWPSGGKPVAARWLPSGGSTWTAEVLPLPAAGYSVAEAWRINADGGVAVTWNDLAGVADAWVWSPAAGWTLLTKPSTATGGCYPWGMNDAYQVVGSGSCGGGFFWASPTATPAALPVPSGATIGYIRGNNNAGVIVGYYTTGSYPKTTTHPSRWLPNGAGGWTQQDLPGVVGGPSDINDDGVIIGSPAYVWFPTSGYSLLETLRPTGVTYTRSVSNRGPSGITWIAGYGDDRTGVMRAIVWKR